MYRAVDLFQHPIKLHAYTPSFPAGIVEALFGEESYVVTLCGGRLEQFPSPPHGRHIAHDAALPSDPIGSHPLVAHEVVLFGVKASVGSDQCRELSPDPSLTDPMLSRASGVGPKAASQRSRARWGRSPFNRCRHFTRCRRARPLVDQHDDISVHYCRCAGV